MAIVRRILAALFSRERPVLFIVVALAALAWVVGSWKPSPAPKVNTESLAALATIENGIESASYQVIANPLLNSTLDAYGHAAEQYDVSEWHSAFMAHFDGVSRNLLDDALFFDADDAERKRLGLDEELGNAEARSIREAALERAVAADGRLVWITTPPEVGGGLLAARFVKRLADGAPIGILVLVPDGKRLALALAEAGGKNADDPDPSLSNGAESTRTVLVDSSGIILHDRSEAGTSGKQIDEIYPGAGRILAQVALGLDEGSAELRESGRRQAAIFARVPGTEWIVVAMGGMTGERRGEALRWSVVVVFAVLMILAFKRTLVRGVAASAAAVVAAADGMESFYLPPSSRFAATERLSSDEGSGAAPAWFRELAPRERSIVLLLAAGKSNKEIAAELGIAEQTVKNRLGLVYERLGVRDRVSAALIVSRARLPGGNFPA